MPRRQKAPCAYLLYSRYYFYLKNMLIKTFLCTLIKLFLQLSYLLNQPWILIRRTDAEAEGPILWPPDGNSWLTGKDPDAGKDWRLKKVAFKDPSEDQTVGRHNWFNGYELWQTLRDDEGQGGLACCSPLTRRVGYNWATEKQYLLKVQNIRFWFTPAWRMGKTVRRVDAWFSFPVLWLYNRA